MYDAQETGNLPPSHYEYVAQTPIATVKTEALYYMQHLEGWCSEFKASILIDLIYKTPCEKIVEIGVWGGKSLVPMACALRGKGQGKIYGIDPWDPAASIEEVMNESNKAYWGWTDHEAVLQGLNSKIAAFQLQNYIQLIRDRSQTAPLIENIDILHIDGNHSDKTSFIDVQKWVPLVRSGGWIIFDDMTWYENGTFTTARAVEWLDTHCIKVAEYSDNCIWGIWTKP